MKPVMHVVVAWQEVLPGELLKKLVAQGLQVRSEITDEAVPSSVPTAQTVSVWHLSPVVGLNVTPSSQDSHWRSEVGVGATDSCSS